MTEEWVQFKVKKFFSKILQEFLKDKPSITWIKKKIQLVKCPTLVYHFTEDFTKEIEYRRELVPFPEKEFICIFPLNKELKEKTFIAFGIKQRREPNEIVEEMLFKSNKGFFWKAEQNQVLIDLESQGGTIMKDVLVASIKKKVIEPGIKIMAKEVFKFIKGEKIDGRPCCFYIDYFNIKPSLNEVDNSITISLKVFIDKDNTLMK